LRAVGLCIACPFAEDFFASGLGQLAHLGVTLRRLLDVLDAGDVLTVTRLDRLARSTRDLLNTLAAITGKKAGFRSLGDTWADTTTSHGRLMLTVLGGLADDAERVIMRSRALYSDRTAA